jgi:hypothetical protein
MTRQLVLLATFGLLIVWPGVRADAQEKPAGVSGAWHVSMQGQAASVMQTLSIEQKGGAINGTLKAPQGEAVPFRGTVTGANIAFTLKRKTSDGDVTQEFAGTVSGDSITGTVTQGQFHVSWTAARLKQEAKSH